MDSEARLRLVAEAAKLSIDAPPIPLPSDSNDAWKIGELVLRICWRGDRTRLQREALILEHLPDEVPHVGLAAAGVASKTCVPPGHSPELDACPQGVERPSDTDTNPHALARVR